MRRCSNSVLAQVMAMVGAEVKVKELAEESEPIDLSLEAALKGGVLKNRPLQKLTCTGRWTKFKAFVAIRDYNSYVGLGVKCFKEAAVARHRAMVLAYISIDTGWRGHWGIKIGKPHIISCKVTGLCVSVLVCLINTPRSTSIIWAPGLMKVLRLTSMDNCYTEARGCAATLGTLSRSHLLASPRSTGISSHHP
ncbi:small ribosomal subunit protein uS5-like [Equus przewalskii]|uniref:Small ribosomal subunit protein uS5-like n=1 Tax=Equus przewalskii TaxID=9798 RepID=A0ABM4PAN4_EQUPR